MDDDRLHDLRVLGAILGIITVAALAWLGLYKTEFISRSVFNFGMVIAFIGLPLFALLGDVRDV